MAPNSGDGWIKTLLDSLQTLYSKLSVLILNRRMNTYRKESSSQLDKQILSALFDIVEKTPEPQSLKTDSDALKPEAQADRLIAGNSKGAPQVKVSNAPAATLPNDLSSHMHSNLSKTSDSKHLGEKLKSSAWDHIHTSLRYVREGNTDLAKMYAGLANEALQQASHHMTDEAYIELKTSVLEELQKLRE